MLKTLLCVLSAALLVAGCKAPVEQVSNNRFSDEKLQRIYELQDRGETRKLIPLLKSKKAEHREAAVLAFASIQDSSAVRFLRENLLTDSKPNVRKAAAYSIGQMRDSVNVPSLFMALENEIVPEVRLYIMDALGKSANQVVVNYFNSFNTTVTLVREGHARGMYRALYQGQIGDSFAKNCIRYFDIVSSEQTKFYAASVLARLPKEQVLPYTVELNKLASLHSEGEVGRLLRSVIEQIEIEVEVEVEKQVNPKDFSDMAALYHDKPYELVNYLHKVTLTDDVIAKLMVWSFDYRYQVVRTTAAELCFKDFNIGHDKKIGERYFDFIERCITSRDMALQSLACYEIRKNPNTRWEEMLMTYRDSLAMPRQIETYLDMGKALVKIRGEKFVHPPVKCNHPIDWSYVKQIPSDQHVEIETNKGFIVIRLNVNEAPGSVSNFLKQVDDGFYNGKFFHRVVPNFVIQAGCVRGDGWGSPDWTQRSEFSNYLTYETGAVGLASGGKDTEGVQFFITHNPTPFLDGRYSIFAFVQSGMDVVNQIGVGDKIIQIRRVAIDPTSS